MVPRKRVLLMLLVVAAEKIELTGIKSKPNDWTLVANGPGRSLAKAAVGDAKPTAILNTGFCGGLDPSLAVGQLFVANKVVFEDSEYTVELPDKIGNTMVGTIACSDRVVISREEKADLRSRTGAHAVDMESFAVAECAQRLGVPFYCVRIVSDTAHDTFPLDFNLYRDEFGRFRMRAIAMRALLSPFRVLPELIRFQKRCAAASEILGEFLVNCRFSA